MGIPIPTLIDAIVNDPMHTWGPRDSASAYTGSRNANYESIIKVGIVEQFNVGMYSALVSTHDAHYVCFVGALNLSPGFGYSDDIVLREGDQVIFAVLDETQLAGVVLARKPTPYSVDQTHPVKVQSDTKLERRTHFFSHDCYRKMSPAYDIPLKNPLDISTARFMCNRPTDLVPGETGMLNPHRAGFLCNMYSTSMVGGGAHVRIYSIENRIRIVADSIIKHTLFGNEIEWHNRRYLSKERAVCMYQEERLGMKSKNQPAFVKSDYDTDGYFIKNKKKKQTLRNRILDHEGYFGNLDVKYCLRPDPDSEEPRTMDDKPKDPGVVRESIDPSGQYRLAFTGMLGLERIGRIPVPIRIKYPWPKDTKEPPAETLEEFQHDEENPYYRQLELADRVAYDLKNSYRRLDESEEEFYTPEEVDLEDKLKDIYDEGFTDSKTVKLEKYDKRRSGIWQGEDGSIIIRDAWGSEIVMIGGNIQLACAGNIEILPGKSALTLAGDDIIHKAQNSIDIEAADKDVRLNAFKNVQIMAGADESNPGGITLESKGKAYPWDAKSPKGGEAVRSTGILFKAHEGNIVTDTENLILRSSQTVSLTAGKEKLEGGGGSIYVSADNVYCHGETVNLNTNSSTLHLSESALLIGQSVIAAGTENTAIFKGTDILVPLIWAPIQTDIGNDIMSGLQPLIKILVNEKMVARGYTTEKLEKMMFKFRNSQECDTEKAWEIESSNAFTLYEPFWVQIKTKFETLKSVTTKDFEDHPDAWGGDIGNPWPGKDAVNEAKYAKLANDEPINLDDDGFNKPRKEVQKESPVTEVNLFPSGYKIRDH